MQSFLWPVERVKRLESYPTRESLFETAEIMSKKNNLAKRKKQHEFDLQREKLEKQKKEKKLKAKKNMMKVDGSGKTKKRGGFQVGKRKVKTKLTAVAKAKVAQAMEVDK